MRAGGSCAWGFANHAYSALIGRFGPVFSFMIPKMAIRKPVSPITWRMYPPGQKEAAFRVIWRPIGLGDDDDGAFWRHLEPFSAILAVFCPLEPEIDLKTNIFLESKYNNSLFYLKIDLGFKKLNFEFFLIWAYQWVEPNGLNPMG